MKTSSLNKSYIIFAALLAVGFLFSCKKKDSSPTAVSTGTFALHLHTDVDTTEVDSLGQVYNLADGRQISVSFAQLYLSHVQLIKLDGSSYEIPGVIILKRQENEEYILGSVPSGNYKSISFQVGLDATQNQYSAGTDTVLNHANMWFDSTGAAGAGWGYRFINFQGKIDVTPNGQGPVNQMQPFQLKLGGTLANKTITMPEQDYAVAPNQVTEVHVIINYAYLFHGVDVANPANLSIQNPGENTGTQGAMDNNITVGTSANSEIPTAMFTYEHE